MSEGIAGLVGEMFGAWNNLADALSKENILLRSRLASMTTRAQEWEQRAKRANDDRADLVQRVADLERKRHQAQVKIEELQHRIGDQMERDAQIEPFADAKKPLPDDINPDEEEARAAYRSEVEEREGVRT